MSRFVAVLSLARTMGAVVIVAADAPSELEEVARTWSVSLLRVPTKVTALALRLDGRPGASRLALHTGGGLVQTWIWADLVPDMEFIKRCEMLERIMEIISMIRS